MLWRRSLLSLGILLRCFELTFEVASKKADPFEEEDAGLPAFVYVSEENPWAYWESVSAEMCQQSVR